MTASKRLGQGLPLGIILALAWASYGYATEPVLGPQGRSPASSPRFVTKFTYYANGFARDLVQTSADPAGRVTMYSYDEQRRLSTIAYPDGKTVEYAYDKFGRRSGMKDWTGTTTYEYDTLNRLIKTTQSNGLWVRFEYDWQNRITATTIPGDPPNEDSGWRVEYSYDLLGHLSAINSPVGRLTWEYDYAKGIVTRRMPNGVVSTFSYRPDGLVESIRHQCEEGKGGNAKRVLLIQFAYEYQPDGKVSAETTTNTDGGKETTWYRYDKVERLAEVTLTDGRKISYGYDAMGNRLSQKGPDGEIKYAYDKWDQILQAGDETFGHDASGNVVWREGRDGKTVYEYDAENRLVAVRLPRGSVEYMYNGDGLLVSRRSGREKAKHLLLPFGDENVFLMEVSRIALPVRFVVSERTLCSTSMNATEFYLEDRLGSIRLVTDAKGQTVRSVSYQPFGEPQALPEGCSLAFAGLPHDPVACLTLTKARAYDPRLGRFLQMEPVRQLPTGSGAECPLYAYCSSDPVNFTDRDGRRKKWTQVADYGTTEWSIPIYFDEEAGAVRFPKTAKMVVHNQWRNICGDLGLEAGLRGTESLLERTGRFLAAASVRSGREVLGAVTAPTTVGEYAAGGLSGAVSSFELGNVAAMIKRALPIEADVRSGHTFLGSTDVYVDGFKGAEPAKVSQFLKDVARSYEELKQFSTYGAMGALNVPGSELAQGAELLDTFGNIRASYQKVIESPPLVHDGLATSPSGEPWLSSIGRFLVPTAEAAEIPSPHLGGLDVTPTKIGGVKLDKTARVLADIGRISAVTLDPKTGRPVLVGEKRTALPAVRLDDLAFAMRSIYVEGIDPFVSIDPKAGDVYARKMNVRYSPCLGLTHAGKVMFEADYRLKEYAAGGRGTQRLTSKVKVWKCLSDLEREMFPNGRTHEQDIWYRFWLKPADITLKPSPDGKSLAFEPAHVRVETENMILKDGKLERVENVRDPVAEAFAQLFTDHYDEFAAEDPVYEELRQLAQVVGLVKWMYQQGIDVDLRWVMRHAAPSCQTPMETDSLWAEVPREEVGPQGLALSFSRFFGGVELATTFKRGVWSLQEEACCRPVVQEVHAHPKAEAWSISTDKGVRHAAPLPGCTQESLGAYRTRATDLIVRAGGSALPLTRCYNSLFNEPTEWGRGWTLSIPHLYARKRLPTDPGGARAGALPVLVLSDDAGSFQHVFALPRDAKPDGTICYGGPTGSGVDELRVLPNRGGYGVTFEGGLIWSFDVDGYLLKQALSQGDLAFQYVPAEGTSRRLSAIALNPGDLKPVWLQLAYDESGRICEVSGSDAAKATYAYDAAGNLQAVFTSDGMAAYAYNANHQLTRIDWNGKLVQTMTYDDSGLLAELGTPGSTPRQFSYEEQGGGNAVVEKTTSTRTEYDDQWRLQRVVRPEAETDYGYYPSGQLQAVRHVGRGGLTTTVRKSEDQRTSDMVLPTGAKHHVEVDGSGRLLRWDVNGTPVANLKYDQIKGRLEEASLPTMRVQQRFRADDLERVIVSPARAGGAAQRLEIAYDGGQPSVLKGPDGLSAQWQYADKRLQKVVTPRGTVELQRGAESDRLIWSFGRTIEWVRGNQGQVAKIVDKAGQASREAEYAQGRPMQITNFDGGVTRYAWEGDRLTGIVDAYGDRIDLDYTDVAGRKCLGSVRYPNGRRMALAYDTQGRLVRIEE